MTYLKTAALAILGTLALTANASAAVVCNEDGDCWRTKERLTYPPAARVQIYGDDYTLGPKYRWREPGAGRGYYRGGVWVGFSVTLVSSGLRISPPEAAALGAMLFLSKRCSFRVMDASTLCRGDFFF